MMTDRELLLERLERLAIVLDELMPQCAELVRDAITQQEAVVRCKDCKYNDDGECIIKAGWFPVKPDWFCADGERK